jgi:hypothetical protein
MRNDNSGKMLCLHEKAKYTLLFVEPKTTELSYK